MKLCDHPLYRQDIEAVAALPLPWEKLKQAGVLITGATGLVGSFLVDVLMEKNRRDGLACRVYAMGRNAEKAKTRFAGFWDNDAFTFVPWDVNRPLQWSAGKVDYVLHLASNTHPVAYATDPIGTITANIIGTENLLSFSAGQKVKRFAFASSNEIYGENRGDCELFTEDYCGYIDCNTLRAGYPEGKRCGEALCQAYAHQMDLDVVIPRLTRSYGPTILKTDTKAISQFIGKAVAGEDIVLKSAGTQQYSYTYVADAVSGLLTVLLLGEKGNAYNIADTRSDIMLRDLAESLARLAGTKVVFDVPDEVEKAGYSKATKARLDSKKLQTLGWQAMYDIYGGLARTVQILKEVQE